MGEPAVRPLAAVPGLCELAADPALLERLALDALLDLQRQLGHLSVDVGAAVTRQMARRAPGRPDAEPADDWISLDEAAALVSRPRSWLLRRHPRPAWLKRLGRKTFVVSRRALDRWLDSRPS